MSERRQLSVGETHCAELVCEANDAVSEHLCVANGFTPGAEEDVHGCTH
jgi:hypothetical protein